MEETTTAKQDPFRNNDFQCSAEFAALQYKLGKVGDSPSDTPSERSKMECTVNWVPAMGMGFVAETGSGHLLTMYGAVDGGGRNLAPRPMETVLAGTAGCTAYDVVLILKRGHAMAAARSFPTPAPPAMAKARSRRTKRWR